MKEDKKARLSLSTQVLIGLMIGILTGVFFGEAVAFLKIVGDIFIKLLQMSVLPYIVVSLIAGLGRLTYHEAWSLAKKCGMVLLVLWAITIAMVLVMPLSFPDWKTASYFSTALVREKQAFNFLDLFIPSNPFYSLSNNIVPAVVVFSFAVGISLMGLEKKEVLLESLSVFMDVLTKITQFVVSLAPIGIFAITASAVGTTGVEDLGRWQVYLVTYLSVWLVLSFWVLPILVTSLTPLTYRDVVISTKDALITAFATGNLLIVLPILAERSKELLKKYEIGTDRVDVIVPTSFTFPSTGKVLTLSFILFAGWFSGFSVSIGQYPKFAVVGFLSFFGLAAAAVPFLLDFLHIPEDMFQLFLVSDVFTGRFGTLLGAMHVLVLTLLGTFAISGRLNFRWKSLVQYAIVSIMVTVALLGSVRFLFTYAFEPAYTKYKTFVESDLLHEPAKSKVYDSPLDLPPSPVLQLPKLELIRKRGSLRAGYFKDSLPFAFRNSAGELVGFDIEMAHGLAKELEVTLDLVLIERKDMVKNLNSGVCDIIMSSLAVTTERSQHAAFSVPYMDVTLGFIVKDYLKDKFISWEILRKVEDLRIGVPNLPYYVSLVRRKSPKAEVIPILSVREFFRKERVDLDALAFSAESGSAWTLVYPEYSVAVPLPDPVLIPLAYLMPLGEREMVDFVNTWIDLKEKDKTIKELYDYWILGEHAKKKEPRWSVIHNVLGWVD